MKRIAILLILGITACKVPEPNSKTQHTSDPVKLYLTYDISINSCLIAWERISRNLYEEVMKGSYRMYAGSDFSSLLSEQETRNNAAFHAIDTKSGESLAIPMERFLIRGVKGGYQVYDNSPFDGSEITVGYLSLEQLEEFARPEEAAMLRLLGRFRGFPAIGVNLDGTRVFTESMLLIDTLQKHLAYRTETEKAFVPLNDSMQIMPDSVLHEKIHQFEDSLTPDRRVAVKLVRVPEFDQWKGFMGYGNLAMGHMQWQAFALLYHPNTKYGGYNPGRIPWFAVSTDALKEKEQDIHQFLNLIANNAMLYLTDPDHYTSEYYTRNSIDIENTRYTGRSHSH